MTINPAAAETMFNALKTIALTTKTSEVLKALDPMAYAQVIEAIAAAEAKVRYEIDVAVYYNVGEDDELGVTVRADFRTEDGSDRANYEMAAEVNNNFPGEVRADPELSEFFADVRDIDAAEHLVKTMQAATDNVLVIDWAF